MLNRQTEHIMNQIDVPPFPWGDILSRLSTKSLCKLGRAYPSSGLISRMHTLKTNYESIMVLLLSITEKAHMHNLEGEVQEKLKEDFDRLRSLLAMRCRGERLHVGSFTFKDADDLLQSTRSELEPNSLMQRVEDKWLYSVVRRKTHML